MSDPIKKPMVDVTPDPGNPERHNALCFHCPWEYSNVVKSDVQEQAKRHRDAHRRGVA